MDHITDSRLWNSEIFARHGGTLVFLAFFALYLVTLSPTITEEDSGDFIMSAWFLGAPHPTGYPAFVLSARLATLVPLGDVAYRVNLLSATFGALSCATLFRFFFWCLSSVPAGSGNVKTLDKTETLDGAAVFDGAAALGALAGTFAFGTARDVWLQSVIAEVYTLANLFIVLLLWTAASWVRAVSAGLSGRREFLKACLILGLGMANHHSIALAAAVCLVFALAVHGIRALEIPDSKTLAAGAGLFFLGVLPYFVFPIRTIAGDPAWNWGDPDGLWQIFRMVTRTQYDMTAHVERNLPVLADQLSGWVLAALGQWGSVIFIIGLCGLVWAAAPWLRDLRRGVLPEEGGGPAAEPMLFTAILAVFSVGIVAVISNPVTEIHTYGTRVFFIPGYLAPAFGIAWLVARAVKFTGVSGGTTGGKIRSAAAILALVTTLLLSAVRNFMVCDGSDNLVAHDFNMNILKSVEEPAALMVSGDAVSFPLHYLTMVQGVRREIPIVSVPSLSYHWYLPQMKRRWPGFVNFPYRAGYQGSDMIEPYIERIVASHPELKFHFTSMDREVAGNWDMVPRGLVYSVKPKGFFESTVLAGDLEKTQRGIFSAMRMRLPRFFKENSTEFRLTRLVAHGLIRNYAYISYNTGTMLCEGGLIAEALEWFDRALAFLPDHEGSLLNRGYCLRAMGRSTESLEAYIAVAETPAVSEGPEGDNRGRISAYHNMAAIYLGLGKSAEAVFALEKAVALDSQDPVAWANIGVVLMKAGKLEKATDFFLEALRRNPVYGPARENLGKCREILAGK